MVGGGGDWGHVWWVDVTGGWRAQRRIALNGKVVDQRNRLYGRGNVRSLGVKDAAFPCWNFTAVISRVGHKKWTYRC